MDFYVDWFDWAEKRGGQLAHTHPLALPGFAADLQAIVKADVAMFQSLESAVKGGFLGITVGLATWASKHPDPLKPQREAMRVMRLKYGEVESAGQ